MHVAITGASSGIGEAIAYEYARRGAALTLVARRGELLKKIAAKAGGKTHCVAADLADVERACDWLSPAEKALGPIDVLINNAGIELISPTAAADWSKAEALLRLNLITPLKLNHAVLPGMIERGTGCIVDVVSISALTTPPTFYFYGASKGGLAAASESLRGELKGTGVHVVTVYPGPIRTDMGERAMGEVDESLKSAPLRRFLAKNVPWGTPDVLARRVAQAVKCGKPRVIYPRFYMLQRWLPAFSRWATDLSVP